MNSYFNYQLLYWGQLANNCQLSAWQRQIIELDQEMNTPWTESTWSGLDKSPRHYQLFLMVHKEDFRLGGLALFEVDQFEGLAHLLKIVIAKRLRGQGLGRSFFADTCLFLASKAFNKGYLEVDCENHAAISLYKNMGWRVHRIARKFYQNGHDAYIMLHSNIKVFDKGLD